ncbi:hypothetical protein [Mucilaginibacter sp. HD30]
MNNKNNDNELNASALTVAQIIKGNKDKHAALIKAILSFKDIIPNLKDFPIQMPQSMR